MDAFFAAVEEHDNPRLRGRPIVVGADPDSAAGEGRGRGVVSTANYAARAYGIYSAMPISEAWRLSEKARNAGKPPVAFVTPNFSKYEPTSGRIMALIAAQVLEIEPVGIDEAYLDLGFTGSFEDAEMLCRKIKKDIKAHERLTATVGIGPNKLIAKIASDMHKPDGLTVVRAEEAEAFVEPMSVRVLPGVGAKTEAALNRKGIRIVRDLKRFSREQLRDFFGTSGDEFYEKARARDDSPVVTEREIKSIGEEETFDADTRDAPFVVGKLQTLAGGVMRRLKGSGFAAFRRVVLTVRFEDFETKTKSRTLGGPQPSLDALQFEACSLLMPFFDTRENPKKKKIRLIGVRVERLT